MGVDMPRGSLAPMSRRRRVLKIVAIDACVLLLCLELLPRVIPIPGLSRDVLDPPVAGFGEETRTVPHPYLAYALKPSWSSPRNRKKSASHNRLGFRGPEIEIPKPAGTFRVLCLGGSSTYGAAPTEERFFSSVRKLHPNSLLAFEHLPSVGRSSHRSVASMDQSRCLAMASM